MNDESLYHKNSYNSAVFDQCQEIDEGEKNTFSTDFHASHIIPILIEYKDK